MKRLLVVLLFMSRILWARDAGSVATQDFSVIPRLTEEIFQSVSPQEVLVVFDIDNTLLRFNEDLGSEQWFIWQRDLLDHGIQQLPLVATSVEDLLQIQSWIYNVTPMTLVTVEEGYWINYLRNLGTPVIALTSRALNVHEATLREIKGNFLSLAAAPELGLVGEGTIYLPYSLQYPEASGLTHEDISDFKLGEPRPVVFDQGIFMTQGQHKGVMLKTLLARMKRTFKAVIFIDDRSGHIEAMRSMAASVPLDIYSIHFNLSETWTQPFLRGEKSRVENDWCGFAAELNQKRFRSPETRIYRSCGR